MIRHIDYHALTHHADLAAIREEILDWFREHGLDPDVAASAEVDTRSMEITEYVFDSDGNQQFDPNDPDKPLTRTRRVPIKKPFPEVTP